MVSGSAVFYRGLNTVTGVRCVSRTPVGGGWLRQVLLAHFLIALKTTRRQNDAPASAYTNLFTVLFCDYTDYAFIFSD